MDEALNAKLLTELDAVETSSASPIPFEVFSRKLNKSTQLINATTEHSSMKGKNDWFRYELEEPVFIKNVSVYAEGYEYKDAKFIWNSVTKSETPTLSSSFENGSFSFTINDFVDCFSFKPDAKYLSTPLIKRVVADGFTLSQFDTALGQLANLREAKRAAIASATKVIQDAREKQTEIASMQDSIKNLNAEKVKLQGEIEDRRNEAANIEESIKRLQETTSKLQADSSSYQVKIEQQEATIEERLHEREQLMRDITSKTSELKALENDIYLFPSEISEFSKKGGVDKAFYWKLAAVPLLIVSILTIALIKNAADLSTVLSEQSNARIFSIFITRMPYVIVSAAIIAAMYKIAGSLINQIMKIDTETRALAKMSIIATDVSAASHDGLELSDEEIYHLRTGLKMDLLRDHLKSYMSEDYRYLESERVKSRFNYFKRERLDSSNTLTAEITDKTGT